MAIVLRSSWRSALRQRWRASLALRTAVFALVFGVMLNVVSTAPSWWVLELKGFDLMTLLSAPRKSALPIVLVGIDDASLAEMQQRWPWPRSVHADLIRRLKEAGVAVVAFDIVFDYATDPKEDAAFTAALHEAGNVVIAAGMVKQETSKGAIWSRKDPLPAFRDATATGFVNLEMDRDLGLRRIPDNDDAFWRQIVAKLRIALPEADFNARVEPESFIRYIGPIGTFPRLSYMQALKGELPREQLQDTVVIVGRETRSAADIGMAQVDTFVTPFTAADSELMPGIEVHANILENVLTASSIQAVPSWARSAFGGLLIFLVAWLMPRFRPVVSALVCLAAVAAATALAWMLFARFRIWLPAGYTLTGVGLLYVTQAVLAYLREREQRRAVKLVFARYVPEEVVNQLAAHPERLALGGENRELTLMFTDLAGFTTLAETLEPARAADLLNRYLTEMNKVIFRYGGTIDKFIGDAIMAFWNAPLPDGDHAKHAVQAALEMQEAMAGLNAELTRLDLPPLSMRIGIHTGPVLVGNMGSAIGRLNYTAIGDAVNLASRLEGANKYYGTDILISGATAALVSGEIPLRQVDLVRVKGKKEAVAVLAPCHDVSLAAISNLAVEAFQRADWDHAESLWREVAQRAPEDSLASLYLQRITEMRMVPPDPGWDGSSSLENK